MDTSGSQRDAASRDVERRKHKRFAVPCPVRVIPPAGDESAGKSANISDGGVLVTLPRRALPARGSLVDVILRVPRSTPNTYMLEEFVSQARVVRHEGHAEASQAAAGLQFVRPLALALEV